MMDCSTALGRASNEMAGDPSDSIVPYLVVLNLLFSPRFQRDRQLYGMVE